MKQRQRVTWPSLRQQQRLIPIRVHACKIGEALLVRSSSPNPTSRTFITRRNPHFLDGNREFRQMIEVSGRGFGGNSLQSGIIHLRKKVTVIARAQARGNLLIGKHRLLRRFTPLNDTGFMTRFFGKGIIPLQRSSPQCSSFECTLV